MSEETKQSSNKRKRIEKDQTLEIVGEVNKKVVNKKLPAKNLPQLSFDSWWLRMQKKYNFSQDLKEVIYKHFRARGYLQNKKFDEGLKDFGVKS